MASMKDIKQRISNIRSTEQIIKAMDMISSTKLQKARAQLEGARPIYEQAKRMIDEAGRNEQAQSHPFYQTQKAKHSLYMILTSNRGLSGSYNSNIMTKALAHMNQGKNEKIIVVGTKGYEYFKHRGKNIVRKVLDMADAQVYHCAENLAKWVIDLYLSGEVQEVYLAYTQFETVLRYNAVVEQVLPLNCCGHQGVSSGERTYEPDIETFVDHAVPFYLHMYLFRAFLEAHTSEQAARMVSMDAAGKNASDMIEQLTRMYHRKRQTAITQELSEIVGSANVLSEGGLHEN